MKIERRFSAAGRPVADQIIWKYVDVRIEDGDGKVIFEMPTVEVPSHWSDNAAQILANKYFRKAGVPELTTITNRGDIVADQLLCLWNWLWPRVPLAGTAFGSETSGRQVFHRLAGCWTYWGWRSGLFKEEEDAQAFYDECYMMLAWQIGAPNSPQWFNTGLHWAYGIEGPASGMWVTDEDYPIADGGQTAPVPIQIYNSYERPQPHACFIQPVNDDLVNPGGIMDLWVKEVRLFKHGSGTGSNFSSVRGKGEKLSGGGVSSGLMSFLRIGDQSAGSIASGGVTRRAAKMVILDADHPEIEDFIDWKVNEEYKAACMATGSRLIRNAVEHGTYSPLINQQVRDRIQEGFPLLPISEGWEGEAISTVSGQNSNNSVRVTDEFMEAVNGTEACNWNLRERTTGKIVRSVDPKALWHRLCRAAWACADPGVQFDSVINDWHTCPNDGRINASNPCSEYMFLDNTACNLASMNLVAFLDDTGFDIEKYEHATKLWTIVLDISVSMASFPSAEIALGSYNYRTLGLGYANLGGLLMREGIAYDSDKGRAVAAVLTAFMTGVSYLTSVQLADELGPFPRWDANKEPMRRVLHKHADSLWHFDALPEGYETTYARAKDVWEQVGKAKHFRNAQATLLAPTGTISFVMDCDTTGVEPDFALVKHKNLAGGGTMRIVNSAIGPAMRKLGLSFEARKAVEAYIQEHGSLEGMQKGAPIFILQHVLACANEIDPMGHVKMVAAVQPFLSGAVSKTINLPQNATVEDVDKVYREAHRLGVKAVALYRDGSKMTQPLSAAQRPTSTTDQAQATVTPLYANQEARTPGREMLPWRRERGFTQKVKIDGNSVYLHVGEYADGRPGEIFLELAHQGSTLRAMGNLFAIAVSIGLQHGIPVEAFVKNFLHTKFEPAGIVEGHDHIKMVTSIADYVAKELAITYLGRDDLANVKPEGLNGDHDTPEAVPAVAIGFDLRARATITGDLCPGCHNATLVRAGTCVYCRNCSYNTGCG